MNECIDHSIGDMMHAYELGILSDQDRARFEMHLMECDYCFHRAQSFASEADQLRNRPEMAEAIGEIIERQPGEKPSPADKKRRWPRIIPALAAAAIVIIVLILQPGKLEIRYSDEAVAAENRLAVMNFDNLAEPVDSRHLGEIAANLLIADLSESRYIQVVSSQRIQDLLNASGYRGKKTTAIDAAAQVAKKARARWVLTGNILQTEPNFEISTQLADVSTGNVAASQTIVGKSNEDIFAVIDDLTREIKDDLKLPSKAYSEPDPAVADITTHSEAAYRLYLVGLDYKNKFYFDDAARCFKEALAIDSTLAMAYYQLTWTVTGADLRKALDGLSAYSDRLGWKDRQYATARQAFLTGNYQESIGLLRKILERYPDEKEAYYQIGNYCRYGPAWNDSAVVYMKKAIGLDSLYGEAYNLLAYAYNDLGDVDKATDVVDHYIAIAPDQANPYDSKLDILAKNGRIAEAIKAGEKAVTIKPDFYHAVEVLGMSYVYNKQYEKAAECFRTLAGGSDADYRMTGRRMLPYIPLYQGKFNEALRVLDDAFAAERIEQNERPRAMILKMMMQLYIYFQQQDYATGKAFCERSMDIYRRANPQSIAYLRDGYVHFLVALGEIEQAKTVAEELRKDIEEKAPEQMDKYWYVQGIIAFGEQDFESAIQNLKKTADMRKGGENYGPFITDYWLARAYQEAGHLQDAAAIYESLLDTYDEYRLFWATASVKSHYQLARVYEKMGRTEKAIRQYREFIDIWKEADNGKSLIEDARKRLARLGG